MPPISMQNSGDAFTASDAEGAINLVENRDSMSGTQNALTTVSSLPYKRFCERHPRYNERHWRKLRALYRGGSALLKDNQLLKELFPPHKGELSKIYEERIKRCYYIPYAGEIIDHIVAALCAEPVRMTTEAVAGSSEEDAIPEFYELFARDVSQAGGERMSLNDLMKQQILTALICGTAWTRADLPDVDGAFSSMAEQEASGALNAYALPCEPESVLDWEEDDAGELLWVLTGVKMQKRESLLDSRKNVTERFTLYDRQGWQRFEISYNLDQKKRPDDNDAVSLVGEGAHTFGAVPFIRLTVPDGLHAMEKLESLARAHFNEVSALGWAVTQSLFQEPYEFLGPEEGPDGRLEHDVAGDSDRARNQPRGMGWVQVRSAEDRVEWSGPDTSPFDFALKDANQKRDEMHRVTHQMALTVDNSAAALRRSGDSKAQDKAATKVILLALGQLVRQHAERLYRMISVGRGDLELAEEWQARGMDKFDELEVAGAIENAVNLSSIDIMQLSPTLKKRYYFGIAKAVLADDATEEDLSDIEEELEKNVIDEEPEMLSGLEQRLDVMDERDREPMVAGGRRSTFVDDD